MKNKEKIISLLAASTILLTGCTKINTKKNEKTSISTYQIENTQIKTLDDIAYEVIRGYWKNGHERKELLEAAGYNYDDVMNRVNIIQAERHKTDEERALEEEQRLKEEQEALEIERVAHEVIQGGIWGNMPERKERLEAAGYDYEKVRARVNALMKEKEEKEKQESQIKKYTISGSTGYANVDTELYDYNLSPVTTVSQYQKIILYNDYLGNNRHVCIPNIGEGYMYTPFITEMSDTYVEVDISDQKLYMYKDGNLVLEADVITGKNTKESKTDIGYTQVLSKQYKTYLSGSSWKNVYVDYFIQFNNNAEGFHDADGWRNDSDYNNKELYKTNGSHGCVNMKQSDVEILDYYTEVGTPVLIHK